MSERRGTALAIFAAVAFVALVVVTVIVADTRRTFDGFAEPLVRTLLTATAVLGIWVALVSIALAQGRGWARPVMIATFGLAGLVTGAALFDTTRRVLVESSAPAVHVVLPALLFGLATTVVYLVARDWHSARSGERRT